MLKPVKDYQTLCDTFRWEVPDHYNIGVDICDKWAHQPDRLAMICEDGAGRTRRYTFLDLKRRSNRLANGLKAMGIGIGDRVGILLPQRPETAVSHIGLYKLGAIAIPLFTLFGTDALAYRLGNSQASGVITDAANLPKILSIRDALPQLRVIIVTDGDAPEGVAAFQDLLSRGSDAFTPVRTRVDDPALIICTSWTTGPPKEALHAHWVLLGHLPGIEFPHNFFPCEGDRFWTPADWAWIGGLIDVLFPSWHHGIAVVAHRARKFDPEEAFHLLAKHRIRNAFMPPTALKLMRQVPDPSARHDFKIRTIGSGGETLGEGLQEWGRRVMGVTINDWSLTGDLGRMDDEGYLWFVGCKDDLITSSGYRIGPAEIEECIMKHPAVSPATHRRKRPAKSSILSRSDWLPTSIPVRSNSPTVCP